MYKSILNYNDLLEYFDTIVPALTSIFIYLFILIFLDNQNQVLYTHRRESVNLMRRILYIIMTFTTICKKRYKKEKQMSYLLT